MSRSPPRRALALLVAVTVVLQFAVVGVAFDGVSSAQGADGESVTSATPTPTPGGTTPTPDGTTPTTSAGGGTPTPVPGGATATPTPPPSPSPTPPPTPTPTPTPEPVEGDPDIDAFLPNNTVAPGQRARLTVQLANGGTIDEGGLNTSPDAEQRVTTARNLRVTLEDGNAPVEIRTGTTALGSLPSGEITQTDFDVVVDEDADPGVYDLDVEVEYDYTESISGDEREEESETETLEVTLVVTENARFEVVSVASDVQVGETGTVEVTLENVGEESITNAVVTVDSANADLRVDSGSATTRFVGEWEDGDERTVTFEATAANSSAPQRYALEATVAYTDADGDRRQSMPLSFGVRPDEEQTFDLDDLDGDLRVGEDGTVTGTITNEGPNAVEDAVVRLVDGDGDIVARRATDVLGDLEDGEEDSFSIPVRVSDDAEPGDRQLSVVVEYSNDEGDPRRSRQLRGQVEVGEKRDRFVVRRVRSDVQAGEQGTLRLRLENTGNEDLTDATVVVSSPDGDLVLDGGGNASRFVGDWDEDDRKNIAVEATAANGTAGQRFPVEVTVLYTDEDGDRRRSEPLRVGVTPDSEQAFAIRDVASTLRIGEEGRVNGTVRNTGPRAVSNTVLLLVGTDENVEPRETEAVLGDLDADGSEDFSLPVSVLDTAQPGPRRLTFVVEYENADGDRRRSDPVSVFVDVSSETDRFVVRSIESNLQADDTGSVVLTLRNRGEETLSDATVSLASESRQLLVGGNASDTRFVGGWPANGTRTVRYRVRAANGTGNQTFAFSAAVNYDDAESQSRRSGSLAFGLTPAREQAFAVRTVESTLRVGEEGRVVVRLTNRGPTNVSAIAVELLTDVPNVTPVETEATAGRLEPGGARNLSFPVEITESGEPGIRQFTYRVRYTDREGDRRRSDLLTADARVAPERDPLLVTVERPNVTAGEDGFVTLEITNNRGVPLRSIQAKAFADTPLSIDDDTAFVESLAPNESTTIRFSVSSSGDADTKTYPVSVDFLYTLPDGDQRLSDPFDVGVTVIEPEESPLSRFLIPALVLLLLLVVAVWLFRRLRRRGAGESADEDEDEADDENVDGTDGDGEDTGTTDEGAGNGGGNASDGEPDGTTDEERTSDGRDTDGEE